MGKFSFGNTFKSFDQYGEPIGMNYKGQAQYNTYCGSIMSIFTTTIMLYYTVFKTQLLVGRDNPNTSYNTGVIKNFDKQVAEAVTGQENSLIIKSSDLSFGLGFYLMKPLQGLNIVPIDPRLIEIKVTEIDRKGFTETPGRNISFKTCD